MTAPDTHHFEQPVFGKSAEEFEQAGRSAVLAYFGTLNDVEWTVDTDAVVNMAGQVMTYQGRVRAVRVDREDQR